MSELKFSDLVEPVAVDQKTALRLTVLGGGSFGTAMANTAVRNGCDTMIWIRDEAVAADINATHVNKRYLPDFKLEDGLRAVSNIEEAVRDRDIIWWRFRVILSVMSLNKLNRLLLRKQWCL